MITRQFVDHIQVFHHTIEPSIIRVGGWVLFSQFLLPLFPRFDRTLSAL